MTRAVDLGINFWDTSDIYGPHTNEQLIGKWFKDTGRRKEIFLASKFGNLRDAQGNPTVRGDKEYVKQACHESLERLGVEQIDLYYQHRVDPKVTIEETVQAMVELKKEGKIRHLGLSECSAKTLRRACKVGNASIRLRVAGRLTMARSTPLPPRRWSIRHSRWRSSLRRQTS